MCKKVAKDHLSHDSIYMKFPEQAKPIETDTEWWLPGAWRGNEWEVTA